MLTSQPCVLNWGADGVRNAVSALQDALAPALPPHAPSVPKQLCAVIAARPALLMSVSSVRSAMATLYEIGAAEDAAEAAGMILARPHLSLAGDRTRRHALCLRMFGYPVTAALAHPTLSHKRLLWRLSFIADGGCDPSACALEAPDASRPSALLHH